MSNRARQALSRRMSYALRHRPDRFGLELQVGGWVDLGALAGALEVAVDDLLDIVEWEKREPKRRFTVDGDRIRCAQGHSVEVDLQLAPTPPPTTLWHGTTTAVVQDILRDGLKSMGRIHVHLTDDFKTALRVGGRHGQPVVIEVAAQLAALDGVAFYLADNGVWLTDSVPARYLRAVSKA